MSITAEQIKAAIQAWIDPVLNKNPIDANILRDIKLDGKNIHLTLAYPYAKPSSDLINHLKSNFPNHELTATIRWHIPRAAVQPPLKPKPPIKNIIAVASGKGGVGKSTVSVNLALALKKLGASVALLDADIYGPSQPRLLGQGKTRAKTTDKKIVPVDSYGIQTVSIGYLIDEQSPMIWRGPMVSGALQQLLNDTAWSPCDFMIIDLPPGTGDIQLTLAQKIPLAGGVIVTTPQDIACIDAQKAYQMFNKVNVTTLGVIENMSGYQCAHCGEHEAIFGQGGGVALAESNQLPLLAQIPLHRDIRLKSDQGTPIMAEENDTPLSAHYLQAAIELTQSIAKRPVDYTAAIGEVVLNE